jgi:hypothetical protein
VGQDGNGYRVIWVFGKSEYFFKRGWTGNSLICPSGKSVDLPALAAKRRPHLDFSLAAKKPVDARHKAGHDKQKRA